MSVTGRFGILVGLGLAAALTIGAADAPPGGKVVVPFEVLASKHMAIKARINGKGPYRLIFDLGAPVTLLSRRAGEASGVIKKGEPWSIFSAVKSGSRIETLEAGNLKATGVPAVVFDHPVLGALADGLRKNIDGIVGYTFFARYKTTIDYQTRELTFEPVNFEAGDIFRELPDRLAAPKEAKRRVLAPEGVFGLSVTEPGGESTGVTVASVSAGSAAEAAGLKPGDLLTTLDGRWTATVADVFAAASTVEPGRAVEAAVVREGKTLTLTVTPREGF